MKKLTLLGVMASLCVFVNAQQTPIKKLTVGDMVPAITITGVVNYTTNELPLQNLKDKPYIIVFWGGYCAPCIRTIGKLDSLRTASNNAFDAIIVSDHATKEAVFKTLHRYPTARNLKLPMILDTKQLKTWFPYKVVSHLVWVGTDRVIKAITDGDAVTPPHIQQFISGQALNWPLKNDEVNFSLRQPLLEYNTAFNNQPQQLYYSGFFSYISGINPPNMQPIIDSVAGTQTISVFNEPLVNYCSIALNLPYAFGSGKFVLKVKDSTRFVHPAGTDKKLWRAKNLYCYTLRLPLQVSETQRSQFLREDISNWLARMGISIEKKEDTVYITQP